MKKIILIFSVINFLKVFCQEKKDTTLNLWEGDVKMEVLDEVVFTPISKDEIKDIVDKLSNSLKNNYKKDDYVFINYEENIIANDTIENSLVGKFGVVIPNYQDINIQDIEIAKIFSLQNVKIVGEEQPINAASAPFIVPTMGFVLPIVSIEDAPFVDGISDYKYSGWSDKEFYVISFEPENKKDSYKFCGKIVINKLDFSIVNINYSLCTSENIMKMKDLPYVSNKLSFSQKFKIQAALLFVGSVRRFSNNLYCNTLSWKTDIGYRKDTITGKYTLDYLTINSSSVVKGKMEEELLEKVTNDKARNNLKGKEYIDVIQKYKLNITTSDQIFPEINKDTYLNALFYEIYQGEENYDRNKRKLGISDYNDKLEKMNKILKKKIDKNEN